MLHKGSSSCYGKDVETNHRNGSTSEDQGVRGSHFKTWGWPPADRKEQDTVALSPIITGNQTPPTAAMDVKVPFPLVKLPEENTAQWTRKRRCEQLCAAHSLRPPLNS